MSSSQNPQDWETILSKLTEEKESKQSVVGSFTGGIFAFAAFNALSALAVMLLNATINRAWENFEFLRPGIGYADAFSLTGLIWLLYFLKVGVSMAFGRSNAGN